MADDFEDHQSGLTSPAEAGQAITSSDAVTLAGAIYVGGTGDLRVTLLSGGMVTLVAAQVGMIYPLRASRLMATGTTATGLVALR